MPRSRARKSRRSKRGPADRSAWKHTQDSSRPLSELLFGEFDSVRGTDVVGMSNSAWELSSGATNGWARLNGRLVKSFANAVVADFNGNGKSDIGFSDGKKWRYSRDGRVSLAVLRDGTASLKQMLVGRFDGRDTRAQAVTFDSSGLSLALWRGLGRGSGLVTQSSQSMR